MNNIVLIPKTTTSQTDFDALIDRYKRLRLTSLKSDPQAFSSKYEDEIQFPYEKWRDRIQNPEAWTFIALDEESVEHSMGDPLDRLLSREWLGRVTLVGPKVVPEHVDINSLCDFFIGSDQRIQTVPSSNSVAVYMIAGMYVLPDGRRKGYGQRLIEEAVRYARMMEKRALVVLIVERDNDNARRLYKRLGFSEGNNGSDTGESYIGMVLDAMS